MRPCSEQRKTNTNTVISHCDQQYLVPLVSFECSDHPTVRVHFNQGHLVTKANSKIKIATKQSCRRTANTEYIFLSSLF